ncbi:MAG: polysaccharide biosynthesis tyrosine autokinase [Microbacterium sp.]|uniref:non-specific protein-tyrosine kinase n=1 Tax=Microbacterium natoriense TaxID=284570 RepID=A0AAW8EUG5_9MICO|nr:MULTISPECIES: polysaccharide biosynthesis tyrosine autokinase [Microbacterium]MBW8762957.1 polysaccharide biosynthesis tyrosine autokinase [Microbacterium sp.]MDQ0646868.1 capsular exopolysaccharide synthesis family protein [Microbacterium natoriense]
MTLQDYVDSLRKHWLVIIALTILGAGAAFGYARTLPPEYSSTAAVMVVPQRGDSTNELVQGTSYVQSLVQTYAVLASSPLVLSPVIDELGLEGTPTQLAKRVSVVNTLNTVVIEISVTDSSAEQAQRIAEAITDSLIAAVPAVSPSDADNQPAVRLETIAPARMPQAPIGPNTRLLTLIGAAIGLALGVAYALFRRVLGTRVTERADISAVTDAPVIGEIVAWRRNYSILSTMLRSRDSRSAESFRGLAANLKYVAVDRDLRVVMMTSSAPHEGKSSVSIGLATALAEPGHSVLLIDADLRRSSIATQLQLEGSVGVTSVLVGEATFEEAVQHSESMNIDIIAGGAPAPNPGQLITSHRLRELVEEAREKYEYVIIDSAPALVVSDALLLADLADGVLVVARSGRTRRKQVINVLATLKSTHKDVVGIVLNAVKRKERGPYYVPDDTPGRRWSLPLRSAADAAKKPSRDAPVSETLDDAPVSEKLDDAPTSKS